MDSLNNLRKIKKSTLSESIIEQIKEMIQQGHIKPGQRLPSERELAEALSVSRPSVREAMRSLQSVGIIEIRTGDGTYLKESVNILYDQFKVKHLIKKYSILELIEARKILEVDIVILAAERATQDHKEMLQELFLETIKHKSNEVDFLRADFAYHLAIAETAQNSFLSEMLFTTRDLLLEANLDVIKKPGQIDTAIHSHRKILDAILLNKKDTAKEEMLFHLQTVQDAINEIYANN